MLVLLLALAGAGSISTMARAQAPAPAAGSLAPAATASPLPVQIMLAHVAADTWRVDYRFAEPVAALGFKQVGDYRKSAWKVLTPGATLVVGAGQDLIAAEGGPLDRISVEITTFDDVMPGQYVAMDRFSDGGRAVYLGFLQGVAVQDGRRREMASRFTFEGLERETVVVPASASDTVRGGTPYAYFGPRGPVPAGDASVILDPALPPWVVDTLLETTAKISSYYGNAYGQKLRQPLLLLVAAGGGDGPGLSIKGGAAGAQIAYRFGGAALEGDHPKKRQLVAQVVAHEMAHLWQNNVRRGGASAGTPWVLEGGAEAMALDALTRSGVWTAEQGRAYVDAIVDECGRLGHGVQSYRGAYACGFERYQRLGAGIVPLWRAMMSAADERGEIYTEALVEALTNRP